MPASPRLKRVSLILAAVLALGLLAFLSWLNPEVAGENPVAGQEAAPELADAAVAPAVETDEGSPIPEANRDGRSAEEMPYLRQSPAQPVNVPVTIPHDVVMDQYKRELWADIEASPPPLKQPGDPEVDADLAYRIYMFYGNCSVVPRTAQQVDQRLGQIMTRVERAGPRHLEGLEGRVDEIIGFYELCSSIPDEVDRREEAVVWMTEAVRLEHEIAEVQFYEKAKGFILRPDFYMNRPPLAMSQPGLVEQFKDTARLGLARALEKGHPEAYVAKAQAVLEGLIYPRDPQLSFAYARAAELVAGGNRTIAANANSWKNAASQYLDPAQLGEAEHIALEIQAARKPD